MPDSVSLTLIASDGKKVDMHEDNYLKLTKGEHKFTLVASGSTVLAAAPPTDIEPLTRRFDSIHLLPERTMLHQNYPNPFNPETWIPFDLAEPCDVKVSIYDSLGSLIRTYTWDILM